LPEVSWLFFKARTSYFGDRTLVACVVSR